MTKRKALSKGRRFDIFKRDSFTCQYCGRQPPEVVLEVDHIRPVAEGGTNEELNLITACEDCNRGKGKKLLENPQRPDADLVWLEAQQEIAEMRRYQTARQLRDELMASVIHSIQNVWIRSAGTDWVPDEGVLSRMLAKYSPEIVDAAIQSTAHKYHDGYISRRGDDWVKYTWGTLKKMAED